MTYNIKYIMTFVAYCLFLSLLYTGTKSKDIKHLYSFLMRVLEENNKKRITREDMVKSMKRYAPIGGVFIRYSSTECVVLGYNNMGIYYMTKDYYLDSCKTLLFNSDDIHCRYYDDFFEENKKPLKKLDGFDEITFLKYKLFSKELSQVPTDMEVICLEPYVIGKTKLNLFVSYRVWILNVLMFFVALILLKIY